MSIRRVTPEEALELLNAEGYTYLDVRSIPEFEQGHPEGAFNVPLLHQQGGAMVPNPDFLPVVLAAFPKDTKLVLGCKAGGRSLKAAGELEKAGYTNLIDQKLGFVGAPDAFGKLEPGWGPKGLPQSTTSPEEKTYAALAKKAGK